MEYQAANLSYLTPWVTVKEIKYSLHKTLTNPPNLHSFSFRIKFENNMDEDDDSLFFPDCCSSIGAPECYSASDDLGVESMADDQSVDFEFNFEEACQR